MDADFARIAFVSRRFNELKGLQSVTVGCALLSGLLLGSVTIPASLSSVDPMGQFLTPYLALTIATLAFEPRYRATFGVSVSTSVADVLSAFGTSLPLLLMMGAMGDTVGFIAKVGGPSVAAVAVATRRVSCGGARLSLARALRDSCRGSRFCDRHHRRDATGTAVSLLGGRP